MSICTRCGAAFSCAMADGDAAPCWCTRLPPVVALPPTGADSPAAGCWCPACLEQHIAHQADAARGMAPGAEERS